MKYFTLLLAQIFAFTMWANIQSEPVSYERKDSDHIKEIMTAWDSNKGEYLYESMAALIMKGQQPERPQGLNQTSFELLQMMDEQRINRMDRIAASELENEKNSSRGDQYYWEEWRNYLQSSKCKMNRGKSSGDPHMTTFDGENYDFQNAGDYLLAASDDNSFYVQTQQHRVKSNIALNGAVVMNINGDVLEFKAGNKSDEQKMIFVNGEEIQTEKTDLALPQGGIVNYEKGKYMVKWPTGEQMSVSMRGWGDKRLYDLLVYVPSCNTNYYGLLGNNDGVKNDLIVFDSDLDEDFERTVNSNDDLFGPGRRTPNVISRQERELFFITRTFGGQFQLDSTTTLFTDRMTDIPDDIRYPSELLTLATLEDEQIEEGLRKAREAGVAEEDLFGAVYDYGHVGLEPIAYNDNFTAPKRSNKYKEPAINNEGNKGNSNTNKTTPQVRVRPSIFIGTGVQITPPRQNRPVTSPRPVTRGSGTPPRTAPTPGRR
ncbi:MAG TPA: VWD domain-containing protein [Brumimicrobium sp.]|nr:VWD domain-containing protein [Brumimicrobium sp.]